MYVCVCFGCREKLLVIQKLKLSNCVSKLNRAHSFSLSPTHSLALSISLVMHLRVYVCVQEFFTQ